MDPQLFSLLYPDLHIEYWSGSRREKYTNINRKNVRKFVTNLILFEFLSLFALFNNFELAFFCYRKLFIGNFYLKLLKLYPVPDPHLKRIWIRIRIKKTAGCGSVKNVCGSTALLQRYLPIIYFYLLIFYWSSHVICFFLGLREFWRHEPEGGTAARHLRLRLREALRHPAASHCALHQGQRCFLFCYRATGIRYNTGTTVNISGGFLSLFQCWAEK